MLITGGKFLEDLMRTVVFEADQPEGLLVAAFQLLGRPEDQAQELPRSILKAAERPQSGDPDRDLKSRDVQFLIRTYAPRAPGGAGGALL
jgi:hypothetical protein